MALPTLVRSGRGANATFLDVDVTSGRTLFVVRNQTSTSLASNNAGVTLLAADTGGPRRNSIWAIAQGTSGVVRITGSTNAVWGYVLIDWPAQEVVAGYTGNNTTADMGAVNINVSKAAQVAVFWNTNNAADWGTAANYTAIQTITTQLSEPSWTLQCSNAAIPVSTYTSPTMTRGKAGTSLIELLAVASLVAPVVVSGGRPKVWTGSAWVAKPAKVWTGSTWVEKPVKIWTGSTWKTVT